MLSQLNWLPPNAEFAEQIGGGVWQRLFQLLLLPDVQLVLLSLDTLYQFTSRGSFVLATRIFHQVQRSVTNQFPGPYNYYVRVTTT